MSKVAIHHSTYKDNPFASEADIEIIEDLINKDENFYRVYALGQWGILKNIIYENWKALAEPPEDGVKDISYGIDWGYESPCALVKTYWLDGYKFITEELIYKKGLTTPAFIEEVKELIPEDERQREFYAGTDEPNSIQLFFEAGFNIHKAVTDVRDGINFCKAHLIGLIGSNIIKEAQGYKRMEDKNGNVLEEPVKVYDHSMDAMRYSVFSIAKYRLAEAQTSNMSFR